MKNNVALFGMIYTLKTFHKLNKGEWQVRVTPKTLKLIRNILKQSIKLNKFIDIVVICKEMLLNNEIVFGLIEGPEYLHSNRYGAPLEPWKAPL